MPGVCLLTDSTAQFISEDFPGSAVVEMIPVHIRVNGIDRPDDGKLAIAELPLSVPNGEQAVLSPPSPDEFFDWYRTLNRNYDEVITLLHSSHLSRAVVNAEQAAAGLRGRMELPVIDSKTTGIGLGYLIQTAAQAIQEGATLDEILEHLRFQSQKVYSIYCLQSLTYLVPGGGLDPLQALVGEMLGITPLVLLENGRLVVIQKARSPRHLADLLVEFIAEFENVHHLALVRGRLSYEVTSLRERIQAFCPGIPFSEHLLTTGVGALLGPRSLSLVVLEQ